MKPTMKWGARILAVALSASMALPVFADQAIHSPDSQHNDALQAHFQYGEVTDPNAPHWGPAEPSRTRKHAPRALLQRRAQSDGETTPSWKEVPPAGKPARAPFDEQIADGLTFFENASQTVSQQNPDYQSDAKPVFDAEGNVTGISINGQVQDYSTQIPYWCNEGKNDTGWGDPNAPLERTTNLCYRTTNLASNLFQGAATGVALSIVDNAPHIILDDENAGPKLDDFLKSGVLQKALQEWNTLLGKDFFVLKSQTTTNPGESGKLLLNPSKDRIQYLYLKHQSDDFFWAAAGQEGVQINTDVYNSELSRFFDYVKGNSSGSWGLYFKRYNEDSQDGHSRGFWIQWGDNPCVDYGANYSCVHFDTAQEAMKQGASFLVQHSWDQVLVHELGHILGLGHPENPKNDTFTPGNGASGCDSDVSYFASGPLLMQYNRDNNGDMLDGTLETSVQYRMIKDAISAGMNYLRGAKDTSLSTPVVHRSIETSLVDDKGNKLEQAAPLASMEQSVPYSATYSDEMGKKYCGGFDTIPYNTFNPTSDMPQVKVGVKGYEVSLDGGKTWAEDATVPAVKLSPTDAFRFDYTAQGIVYKSHDGKDVLTDLGVKDLPAVQVLYRVAASKPDNPANPGNEPAQPGKDQPAQPGKDKPAQPGKTVQPSKATSKKPEVVAASRLGDTGADASMIALAALLLVAAGCSLTFLSRIHTHE